MKDKGMRSLAGFYLVLFMHQGVFSFASKYMAEVGFDNRQIGVLTAVPFFAGMCFMPLFGAMADRISKKKYFIITGGILSGLLLLTMDSFTNWGGSAPVTRFWPFLIMLTFANIVIQSLSPIMTSVALEYTAKQGRPFGPIRMMGSIGYQAGTLFAGFILVNSLRHLFSLEAAALVGSALIAIWLPNVVGHQHGREKVSPLLILKDGRVRTLLLILLFACTLSSFYGAFFGVFMEELGIGNTLTSIIITFSVLLEIPFLLVADKLAKKKSVWEWLLIGFTLNGLRWLGFYFTGRTGAIWLLFLCQVPALSTLSCYEYFPQLYLNRIVPKELSSSIQTDLNVVTFGLSKIIGSLLGGFISDRIGIGNTFLWCSIMSAAGLFIIAPMLLKLSRQEKKEAA